MIVGWKEIWLVHLDSCDFWWFRSSVPQFSTYTSYEKTPSGSVWLLKKKTHLLTWRQELKFVTEIQILQKHPKTSNKSRLSNFLLNLYHVYTRNRKYSMYRYIQSHGYFNRGTKDVQGEEFQLVKKHRAHAFVDEQLILVQN